MKKKISIRKCRARYHDDVSGKVFYGHYYGSTYIDEVWWATFKRDDDVFPIYIKPSQIEIETQWQPLDENFWRNE